MKIENIDNRSDYKLFSGISKMVYQDMPFYRDTEKSIEELLIKKTSGFHNHALVKSFVIRDGNDYVGRFALIRDDQLPDYVQVSFFEALPGLGNIYIEIKSLIKKIWTDCKKVIVGLNGHLNYGAGFLLNRFDEAPLFGLPYTPPYYPEYFKDLTEVRMFTFRQSMSEYFQWADSNKIKKTMDGLIVRQINKHDLKKESAIYTDLNNKCFVNHPYWASRDEKEDLELFNPFRFLLKNENLVFAEYQGKPVGFYLWYPDFNQLVNSQRDLNVMDVIRYKLNSRIDTFRFTEIGILPEFQRSPVGMALLSAVNPYLRKEGFKYCEGGFIFEKNRASVLFATRLMQRSSSLVTDPYRRFAVYEDEL